MMIDTLFERPPEISRQEMIVQRAVSNLQLIINTHDKIACTSLKNNKPCPTCELKFGNPNFGQTQQFLIAKYGDPNCGDCGHSIQQHGLRGDGPCSSTLSHGWCRCYAYVTPEQAKERQARRDAAAAAAYDEPYPYPDSEAERDAFL